MAIVFEPRPLPESVARTVRLRLRDAHRTQPFSTVDPRDTARRVTVLLADLPVATTVYRGGLDLCGMEVDHIWVALARERGDDIDRPDATYVLDAAFPLFEQRFVEVLRRFVTGEADTGDLEAMGAEADIDTRVVGIFPSPMRYLGDPVWSHRA